MNDLWMTGPEAIAYIVLREEHLAAAIKDLKFHEFALRVAELTIGRGVNRRDLVLKAERSLRSQCGAGHIRSVGTPFRSFRDPKFHSSEVYELIPAKNWQNMSIRDEGKLFDLCNIDSATSPMAYVGVRFDRTDVIRRFRKRRLINNKRAQSSSSSEIEIVDKQNKYNHTILYEKKSTYELIKIFKIDPNIKRDDARAELARRNVPVGSVAFRDRVWPEARKLSGLGPARPGPRQKKSILE